MIRELKEILKLLEKNPEIIDNYPFDKSLNEMIIDIEKWLETDIVKMKKLEK